MPDRHSGLHCPSCSSTFVRRLRLGRWDRLQAMFTARRPHTCWHCGWHGWVSVGSDTQDAVHRAGEADAAGETRISPSQS